jgi:biotin-dependent carboxylase-like uncharacterized protein
MHLEVVRAGPLTTVQDHGRPGHAHLGVPRSGALDLPAVRLANRLVGNPSSAAVLETTLLGCSLRFSAAGVAAVTGAPAEVTVDGLRLSGPLEVPAGGLLVVGPATAGVRSYVAVAGGIDVEPVLGSRSTDTLSGLGPPPLTDGMTLPVGAPYGDPAWAADLLPSPPAEILLSVRPGPRWDWVSPVVLYESAYVVGPDSNRVGVRLTGASLSRRRAGELPSEGISLGAIQVPSSGQPLVFLADHPTTGGYPVVGVVEDVTPLAQARPGTVVRFQEGL